MDATPRQEFWKQLRSLYRQFRSLPGWNDKLEAAVLRSAAITFRLCAAVMGRIVRAIRFVVSLAPKRTKTYLPARYSLPGQIGGNHRRPTFGALLCNYNHAKYIERAILSIVNQSCPPDEYLILDDASTDNSVEIIERYAKQYPFIKLIRKEKNEGLTVGMNHLIRLATADFLHFGASDDYMEPGFIENAMALAQAHPTTGIISGDLYNRCEGHDALHLIRIPQWDTGYITPRQYLEEYLEVDDPICTLAPSTLFRRESVLEFDGWRDDVGICWNVSFLLQACALKYGMCYLAMPCYTWVFRMKGLTRITNRDIVGSIDNCVNYLKLLRTPPYDKLFSETFAKLWFAANIKHSAQTFIEDMTDKIIAECRATHQAEAAGAKNHDTSTAMPQTAAA